LLVCDEPTSAIDARTGQRIMELIRQMALAPDRVTVVVTHDARVFPFGDRIITLEDGRVVAQKRSSPPTALGGAPDVTPSPLVGEGWGGGNVRLP